MPASKLGRLQDIKDEVADLHPLLKKLLPRLPRVVDVEYTQGNTEMGADFVFSQHHDTFDYTEYVGIVAKIGALHQNFVEVERQIDECSVPRTFRNGKEKIRLDEVWVVFTGHATKGAQEKIHEKYPTRKVTFIDGIRLEKLIDRHLPSFWNVVPLETNEYLTGLRARNEQLDRSVSLIQTTDKDLYIEQDIYTFPREEYRLTLKRLRKHSQKVDIFDVIEKQKMVLIEGGMGAGKSKLVRRLIDHYAKPEVYINKMLFPIAVTYKEFMDEFDGNVTQLIRTRVSEKLQKEFHDNTKYLLLIDGIDEKNLPVEEQLNVLRSLAEAIHSDPAIKAVITSRYLKALDETTELEREVSRYNLRPLSLAKTIQFIIKLCGQLNLTDRLIEDLKKSPLFHEMPRSPIAAILLANLINENSKDLPSNLTELYSKYVEYVLGRWDIDKGLQTQKEFQALDNILMSLGKYLLENELVFVSIDEAKDMFKSYLQSRNLNISPDDLFNIMIERSELMLIDYDQNRLAFKHRTFAEFFYAKASLRDKDMHIDQRAFSLYWMNSFFFYLGILKDAPEVLRELVHLDTNSEGEQWLKVINMGNFFLAAYATPYDVISEGVAKTMIEAADLYKQIVLGGSSSPFSQMPRMHFLWLYQLLLRFSYSYEFFIRALEDAALLIDEGDYDDTTKAYALFFVNVAYLETGEGRTFDFLLREHADKLPMELALAYKHESEGFKGRSPLMKKMDKRVKRLLRGDRSLDQAVKELYENPIGSLKKVVRSIEK